MNGLLLSMLIFGGMMALLLVIYGFILLLSAFGLEGSEAIFWGIFIPAIVLVLATRA